MSWNISTRLNNLQQQVNNIANKGLTNPLEQVMDANSYTLTNLKILDGVSNVLQLNTNNVGGITTNASLSVDGDLTCQTLNYSSLNPPLNPNGITFGLLGQNVSETTAGNFTFTHFNPYNGIITNQKVLNPTVSLDLTFSSPDGSNSFVIGFSSQNNLYPSGGYRAVQTGIFYYPYENSIYSIVNGTLSSNFYSYTNQTNISVIFKIIQGVMKVFINNTEVQILEQPLTGSYYFVATGYVGITTSATISNCVVSQTFSETLSQVLANGNDGANQNITGINALTCTTLNYTNLNPAITESQNLKAVLTAGNDADGLNIANVGTLTGNNINMTGNIYCDGYLEVGDKFSNTSQVHLFYGSGSGTGNNFQIVGSIGDNFQIQQYKPSVGLYNQPLLINDINYIQLKSNNLIYTQDGTNNYYILDSNFNPPMYKQVYSNQSGSASGLVVAGSPLFSVPIYTKNNSYNYGVNFGEILMSNVAMTFSSLSAFPSGLTATLYLSSSNSGAYDASKGNCLVIPVANTGGQPTSTFNSTIPIVFSYNNGLQFNKLYMLIAFNEVSLNTYSCAVSTLNMVVSGYIASNPNAEVNWGS